ncbi:DUF6514 family protein [Clostridium folliculivorans]|uniref:Uncharacterized protein n=1 Tax=Clostridium folliculivorans TaxID=2886038 RepID=A0A9W5Y531_9CLOT|nr:DUF6514 family protein [Clostridium folliculivorans]GKU26886.1 hypothetical protein CFOLD11_37130 [Clostridium folliculivorans]GKU31537.1 hypothetical protein CFB3_36440 [Clostridium folliculivorans]
MMVVENLWRKVNFDDKEYNYSYRLIKTDFRGSAVYGIEIERTDYDHNNNMVNIERDCIEKISPIYDNVHQLLSLVYENQVSPIHLIDILGERVDELLGDFSTCCLSIAN